MKFDLIENSYVLAFTRGKGTFLISVMKSSFKLFHLVNSMLHFLLFYVLISNIFLKSTSKDDQEYICFLGKKVIIDTIFVPIKMHLNYFEQNLVETEISLQKIRQKKKQVDNRNK